jgi:pyruvate formate lyase activating enzyme
MTVAEVLDEVEKDRIFYEESDGGMTLSGGEPLAQPGFTAELLRGAEARGVHTCLETAGCATAQVLRDVARHVNLFLWDVKDTDPERHTRNTGLSLDTAIGNLRLIDSLGCESVLRCVLIRGVNFSADHLARVAELRRSLRHCRGVDLLPYHGLGDSKRERLGLPAPSSLDQWDAPTEEEMAWAREMVGADR